MCFQVLSLKAAHEPRAEEYRVKNFTPTEIYHAAPATVTATAPANTVDFSGAAAKVIPSVVYINSISQSGSSSSYWDMLFGGGGQQTQISSGSGVIFTRTVTLQPIITWWNRQKRSR